MTIYTPRGLKIRLTVPYAFGLMARLDPKVTPFKILKTAEGIDSLSGMLGFIVGMIVFAIHLQPLQIALIVAISQFAGTIINTFSLYIIPGLIGLSTLFSYISGYGIYLVVVIIAGFFLGGWEVIVAFFLGKIIAVTLGLVVEHLQTRHVYKLTGYPFTASERIFFNAYRFHASRIGITTDVSLNDDELDENYWKATFHKFSLEWPEVVKKFTTN